MVCNIDLTDSTLTAADRQHHTILVVMLARNKAHTLPYFLGHLEDLDYPKNRIALYIRTDHNEDSTKEILDKWLSSVTNMFHRVDYVADTSFKTYDGEIGPFDWPEARRLDVLKMKQEALE